MSGYPRSCHICGQEHDENDPAIRYIYGEGVWECADEAACHDRAATARYLTERETQ